MQDVDGGHIEKIEIIVPARGNPDLGNDLAARLVIPGFKIKRVLVTEHKMPGPIIFQEVRRAYTEHFHHHFMKMTAVGEPGIQSSLADRISGHDLIGRKPDLIPENIAMERHASDGFK